MDISYLIKILIFTDIKLDYSNLIIFFREMTKMDETFYTRTRWMDVLSKTLKNLKNH